MTDLSNEEIIQKLRQFDTATICNVVATYPESDICLKLYDSWRGEYYTDTTLRCIYPEQGTVCGYAATAWYRMKRPRIPSSIRGRCTSTWIAQSAR